MNNACLLKLWWTLKYGENALWSLVLKGKYDWQNLLWDEVIAKPKDSVYGNIWCNYGQILAS